MGSLFIRSNEEAAYFKRDQQNSIFVKERKVILA